MLTDRLAGVEEFVFLLVRSVLVILLVQPSAHRIAAGEGVRVALGVDGAAATSH